MRNKSLELETMNSKGRELEDTIAAPFLSLWERTGVSVRGHAPIAAEILEA